MNAKAEMTSMQRVLTTLGHEEADRVPLFLLTTMHGAKELGMTIKEYFSKAENVIEGQLRLSKKYHSDCLYPFFYAPAETEAMGAEVIYVDDGPPNSGRPPIAAPQDIKALVPPNPEEAPSLAKTLDAIRGLKARVGDTIPIVSVVMSPFSLPVMQMGFDKYFDMMIEDRDTFWTLMKHNEAFCVAWANAQLAAGSTAITYYDPVSSPTVTSRELYLETGFKIARRVLPQINGPTAIHFASGRTLEIADEIIQTGTKVVGTSTIEDLSELKNAFAGKVSVLGNLNGIEMRTWSPEQAENIVRDAIQKGAPGGGFILSDNHGEIPWQVPDEVLHAISDAVRKWGRYPLDTGAHE